MRHLSHSIAWATLAKRNLLQKNVTTHMMSVMNVSWFTILSNCLRSHWRRSRKRPPFLGRIMSWCYTATLRPRITLSDCISTSLDVLRNSGHGQMPWREVNYFLVIYIHIWATPLFRIFAILYLFATHWSIDIYYFNLIAILGSLDGIPLLFVS